LRPSPPSPQPPETIETKKALTEIEQKPEAANLRTSYKPDQSKTTETFHD
jgi:hypothetical protein